MLTMQCGKLGWRHAPAATVRPDLVEVLPPNGDGRSSLRQCLEPVLVQALVAKLAVEALDVAVLHRPARLDQEMANAVGLRPRHEGPAGELRAIVGANGPWIAAEDGCLIEQPGYILARDAIVGGDVDTLMAEVICHGQTLDAPTIGQAVADEIHAPHLIDHLCDLERHALACRTLRFLAFPHRQFGGTVESIDTFVIHAGEFRAQQVVDAPIPESPPRLGDVDDGGGERSRLLIRHRRVPVTIAGEPHKPTGVAFGQIEPLDDLPDGLALDLWG